MSLKHLVFIVNPKSGVERQKEIQQAVDACIDSAKFSYEIQYTQRARHGIDLARAAAQAGAWAVVAVGGDGSVNDVVHGLAGTQTALGIIPRGSGNGLARTLGLPLAVADAMRIINNGQTAAIDLGYVGDRLFLSNAGVAFDALISKEFAASDRRGLAVYAWLVTRHLWTYKTLKFDITIDGKKISENAFMVNVANGTEFGYNFKIAPSASYTDGLLDVVIVKRFPRILGSIIALRAMTGTILSSPWVKHYRGKEVTISHPDMKLMQTDGDAYDCATTLTFGVKPGELQVIRP
jgi:YegS/Rv2252/BmrU family lipid kinase